MAGPPYLAATASRPAARGLRIILLFWCAAAASQDLSNSLADRAWRGAEVFAGDPVLSIQIAISAPDLEHLRQDSRDFVRARVAQGEVTYSNVAIRLKGSVGSFRPLDDKPGFTLDFSRFQSAARFHGLRRIHLNNSVEDPAYCNQQLGSELFRAAGIPAPRVGRAVVSLNGRPLGVYVLVEGFTEDFLWCYFKPPFGALFEPGEGHDVNQRLKRTTLPAGGGDRASLRRLAQAVLERDPARRWSRLQNALDIDQFAKFMALEVMLCHRDGYCLARNNFRLYSNPESQKIVFLPQGLDQLFAVTELPWKPHLAGLVAQAFMEAHEGQEQYHRAFTNLLRVALKPDLIGKRIDQLTDSLRASVGEPEFQAIKTGADALQRRVLLRQRFLEAQLAQPPARLLEFTDGAAGLTGWFKADQSEASRLDVALGPDNRQCLRIESLAAGSPTWRARALLGPGRYRFEGQARVEEVTGLGFGAHQGAGLRVAGQARQSPDLVGTSAWQWVSAEFEVSGNETEIEFICELRAKRGRTWFDCGSLRVVRER
jgi:hypothetical protein